MSGKTEIIIKIGVPVALVAIFGLILIKMFTLNTKIELVQTITAPNLPVISEIKEGDYRQKAISIDGKVIQGTNQNPQPTASTAKMILGLAVMEKYPFNLGESGQTIEITSEFYNKYLWYIANNGSVTSVKIGEKITQYDALVSVFLVSSNNMADTLAIWAFGDLENYRSYAIEMLQKLGLKNTHLGEDASGYSETTTSTAEDLAKIAAKLFKNPVLREIVGLKSYTVPVAGLLTNTNRILGDSLANGAIVTGVKTGYIGDVSGYNLISSYEMDGHIITEALLGATTRQASFDESKAELLRLSQELTPTTIVKKDETVGYYQTWWNGRHDVYANKELRVLGYEDPQNVLNLSEQGIEANINGETYNIETAYEDFSKEPTFIERFLHIFGWHAD